MNSLSPEHLNRILNIVRKGDFEKKYVSKNEGYGIVVTFIHDGYRFDLYNTLEGPLVEPDSWMSVIKLEGIPQSWEFSISQNFFWMIRSFVISTHREDSLDDIFMEIKD
ncbi:hypothetical protein Ab1vBOLIVR5_gp94c [Agrobacterium phage OLIVR5]|uniref:Uncharacterized protein n=1 Tax=Agrobacterium phage OLIVR5 TaxID=2723773 RepID=A0A858MSM0_9CAUD|nr:hypothetical protein KNU99_gp094 [Agrobacterium phage OLIVR5]QIW87742.1 hypothetical protein Ab1vBOLIVR5_gp94c [Agrobacterium phage OLIVR5]QIW88004.1 hypothetical protein Ab1vBOLIVR6_gp97c [Agrobacterium phage OLIVR6]